MNLEQKKQRFLEMVENIEIPNGYSMKISQACTLIESYSKFESIMHAYNYGFKRGTSYGTKQRKRIYGNRKLLRD